MARNLLVFGASTSKNSINQRLAVWAAAQVEGAKSNVLDLNDFEMSIFSVDREAKSGIPDEAHRFRQHIQESGGVVISLAEHNGAYTAAFKNIFDWVSRIDGGVWCDKPMFVLATSPGKRGGQSVLEIGAGRFAYMAAGEMQTFSLPSFEENFSDEDGILDPELRAAFDQKLAAFVETL